MNKYRPEVDAIRAVATVPAVLFHAGIPGFEGGFLGIDIFFVISGYLITSIIITEMADGRFSFVQFFERRARRLLPTMFFVLSVCLVFAWFWFPAADIATFGRSLTSVSLFMSNIFFWVEYRGYFTAANELNPLMHIWSLSTEEQYYIIYPFFLALAWRLGTKWVLILLMVAFLASLGIAVWATQSSQSVVVTGAYYLLPARGWELMVGGLIAFYLYHKTHLKSFGLNQFLSLLGLGLVTYAYLTFDRYTPHPGLYTLIPTIGTALIIFSAVPQTIVYRLLTVKLFVGIGLISYSVFLWHQPMIAFAKVKVLGDLPYYISLPVVTASFFVSWATWKYVEKPFRNLKKYTRKSIFTMSASGIVVFSLIGITLSINNGFPAYNNDVIAEKLSQIGIEEFEPSNRTLQLESWELLRQIHADENYGILDNPADKRNNFDLSSNKSRLLLVGNSHSKDMFNIFHYSDELSQKFDVARYGIDLKNVDNDFFDSEAYRYSQIIMIATWYKPGDIDPLYEIANRALNDQKQLIIVEESIFFDTSATTTAADFTISRELAKERQNEEPLRADELMRKVNSVYTNLYKQHKLKDLYLEKKQHYDSVTSSIVYDHPHVVLLNKMGYICPNDQCRGLTPEGRKIFFDHTHLSVAGAVYFAEQLPKSKFYSDLLKGVELAGGNGQ